jgi:hypothetical protein
MTLVSRAVRRRTRTTVTRVAGVVLAAVFIGAVVVGCQADKLDAAPEPTRPTKNAETFPVGEPLRTYLDPDRLVLYIDGVAEPGTWGGASSVGDLTVAVTNTLDTVAIFVHGARVGTLPHVVGGEVMASPDGRTAAWIEASGESVHLVAASVTRAGVHELGRLTLDPAVVLPDNEGSERVMKVDDDHTVTYGGITSGHVWVPGGEPEDADVSAYLTRATGFPNSVDPPDLNPVGSWGAWPTNDEGRSPVDTNGVWSTVTVQQPRRPDTRSTFVMPHGDGVQSVYWETDSDVIVAVSSKLPVPGSAVEVEGYVRCNVVRRACEYAPTPANP